MTEAHEDGLVERVVTGPKPIWGHDEDGRRTKYEVGSTIRLSPRAAKKFERYLGIPAVLEAEAEAAQALADVEAAEAAAIAAENAATAIPSVTAEDQAIAGGNPDAEGDKPKVAVGAQG